MPWQIKDGLGSTLGCRVLYEDPLDSEVWAGGDYLCMCGASQSQKSNLGGASTLDSGVDYKDTKCGVPQISCNDEAKARAGGEWAPMGWSGLMLTLFPSSLPNTGLDRDSHASLTMRRRGESIQFKGAISACRAHRERCE
jgi:hypothetical protein